MAKTHKKKVKISEMDAMVKRVAAKCAPAAQQRIRDLENMEADLMADAATVAHSAEDVFDKFLGSVCSDRDGRLCKTTNCTCRDGLCPIMRRWRHKQAGGGGVW